jgi:hypothetical protein
MQGGYPNQRTAIIAITMTGADVTGIDPAFNRTGIAFEGIRAHGIIGSDSPSFTYPLADAALRAPVIIDDGFFLLQLDGVHRTIPHTKPAADAFICIYFHGISSLLKLIRIKLKFFFTTHFPGITRMQRIHKLYFSVLLRVIPW